MAAAAATAPATEQEQALPLLKYQTWVLKVSIHCKGCQRKVKRVLQTIEGVYTTEVDLKQHKVTVIGDIDSETLIRKLLKSGKHAELWPDNKPAVSKPSKGAAGAASDASDDGSDDDEGNCDGQKPHIQNVEAQTAIRKDGDFAKGAPAMEKPPNAAQGGGHPMEKPPNAAQGGGAATGAKKKKKKKKKKNSSVTFAAPVGSKIDGKPAGQAGVVVPPVVHPPHACSSPSSPAAAPYHPRPAYAANYSISQPSTGHTTTSYYAPPPAVVAYATALPAVYESPASRYSSESYHIFSDENANACSVM